MDDTNAPGSPHDLLLRLAGRVDDDLLADARELVAVGEDGHALELVTAALAADGTALPPVVRAELVTAADTARIDLDADAALPPAAPDTTAHRFSASAAADVPVIAAARALPDRLRDGIRLRLAWRQTPAGPAPTSLPYPVLLVESPADGRPGEVLAYQMGAAMARSDVHVAVEVLTPGKPLTSYHAAALRDSTPLSPEAPPRQSSPPEKVESVVAEVVEEVTASHRVAAPEERPVDLFAVDDDPAPRPVPLQAWQSGRRRRGFGEQAAEVDPDQDTAAVTDHAPLPSPVPLALSDPAASGRRVGAGHRGGPAGRAPNQPLPGPAARPDPGHGGRRLDRRVGVRRLGSCGGGGWSAQHRRAPCPPRRGWWPGHGWAPRDRYRTPNRARRLSGRPERLLGRSRRQPGRSPRRRAGRPRGATRRRVGARQPGGTARRGRTARHPRTWVRRRKPAERWRLRVSRRRRSGRRPVRRRAARCSQPGRRPAERFTPHHGLAHAPTTRPRTPQGHTSPTPTARTRRP